MKGPLVRIALIVSIVAAAAAVWLPGLVASRSGGEAERDPKSREIRIVARDMTFYVNGVETPNPTLRVKAGEKVRLVLRNEDAGLTHDFAVQAWKVATKTLTEKGQEDSVVFRVPAQRGATAYQCTPHAEMMKGSIQVE